LSERRALAVVGMSASALRYEPRPDQNVALRARIVTLAQRHRSYGSPMIYLKLRQAGEFIKHKRVERLYGLEKLHIKRRPAQEDTRCRSATTGTSGRAQHGPWTSCLIASRPVARSRTW
jgi:hypothetical protein